MVFTPSRLWVGTAFLPETFNKRNEPKRFVLFRLHTSASAVQHVRERSGTRGYGDFPPTIHDFLVLGNDPLGGPQKKIRQAVKEPFRFHLWTIWVGMVFTQPIFLAIAAPLFQQFRNDLRPAIAVLVKELSLGAIRLPNKVLCRHKNPSLNYMKLHTPFRDKL